MERLRSPPRISAKCLLESHKPTPVFVRVPGRGKGVSLPTARWNLVGM